jgi:hypothetical protein
VAAVARTTEDAQTAVYCCRKTLLLLRRNHHPQTCQQAQIPVGRCSCAPPCASQQQLEMSRQGMLICLLPQRNLLLLRLLLLLQTT